MIRLPGAVVVTGVSVGMGRATALALATRGDRAAVARGGAGLEGNRARTTMVQVPAVNTPQFARVLSHVPGRARPGTPVHEADLAARAMDHAVTHSRRLESWTDGITVAPPMANAWFPVYSTVTSPMEATPSSMKVSTPGPATSGAPPTDPQGWDFWAHGHTGASTWSPGRAMHREWTSRNRAWAGKAALIVCGAALLARKVSHSAGHFSSAAPRRSAAPGRGTRKARMSDHIGGETWRDLAS